jgi:site-specific recombinase XerD
MKPNPFPQLLHAFFHEWVVQQRNVSHHTVLSYRDSWRLFLRFVAAQKTKSVAKLGMDDLTAARESSAREERDRLRHSGPGGKSEIELASRCRPVRIR